MLAWENPIQAKTNIELKEGLKVKYHWGDTYHQPTIDVGKGKKYTPDLGRSNLTL